MRERVAATVRAHAPALAEAFYAEMLSHPKARLYLDTEVVHRRLRGSMQRWLIELLEPRTDETLGAWIAHQRHVGEVHARIQLPMHLVARGARFLKGQVLHQLRCEGYSPQDTERALLDIGNLFDLALELMAESYVRDTQRVARGEEAFRLHTLTQNMQVERATCWPTGARRCSLRCTAAMIRARCRDCATRSLVSGSRTRAATSSTQPPNVQLVQQGMERIDEILLSQLAAHRDSDGASWQALLRQLQSELDNLQFLVQLLFERHIVQKSGRDALTRLLKRRFLAPILGPEVHLAQQRRGTFALLLLDIDHFKHVNDQYGHDGGDAVLQQTATLLLNQVRSSDFVFRYGGEEFLLVLVDVEPAQALKQAEQLRQRIADHRYELSNGTALALTASIGVAAWEGHPDCQYLIQRADAALYQATRSGRNRVCLATSTPGPAPTMAA